MINVFYDLAHVYLKVPKFISRKSYMDIESLLLLVFEQCSPLTTCLILEP